MSFTQTNGSLRNDSPYPDNYYECQPTGQPWPSLVAITDAAFPLAYRIPGKQVKVQSGNDVLTYTLDMNLNWVLAGASVKNAYTANVTVGGINAGTQIQAGQSLDDIIKNILIRSGNGTDMIAEYKFEDNNAQLIDSSGNNNHGQYVGTINRIGGGGFKPIAGNGYAKGADGVLVKTSTIYLVCDITPDNGGSYHTIMGSSLTTGNRLQIIGTDFSNGNQFMGAHILPTGGGGFESSGCAPLSPYVVTLVVDKTKSIAPQMFLDGMKIEGAFVQSVDVSDYFVGLPYFGYSEEGGPHSFAGGIYWASFHSSMHNQQQITAQVATIKNAMINRGNTTPRSFNHDLTTNILGGTGDSIMYGAGVGRSNSYLNQTAGLLSYDVVNRGWPGIRSIQLVQSSRSLATAYVRPFAKSIMIVSVGTNNYGAGWDASTVSQVVDNVFTICDNYRNAGWKVILATQLDRDDAGNYPDQRAFMDAVNNGIRNGWTGRAHRLADIAIDIPELGAINAAQNTTYFIDKIHPTQVGHNLARDYYQPIVASI